MKLTLAVLTLAALAGAQEPLADVAFMAGHWRGDAQGAVSEEVWAAPEGNCMIGMWRLVKEGKVRLTESLTITAEAEGIVMRLRHFNADGTGWEEKDKPITLRLVKKGGAEAVFEGPGRDGPLRISYRRPTPDRLETRLDKPTEKLEFTFTRVPGTGKD